MRNIVLFLVVILFSCNADRKKETVSNYVKYIWRIKSDSRYEILALEETGTIKGRDSLDILLKEYSQGNKAMANPDSVTANFEKDERYNSNLLDKTKAKIDSLKKMSAPGDSFFDEYIKSLEQLRDFTANQLGLLRAEKYIFDRYKNEPDQILCRRIACRYKIKKEAPDTSSKTFRQIFYLSGDTRHVLAVKQDSTANKKPGSK